VQLLKEKKGYLVFRITLFLLLLSGCALPPISAPSRFPEFQERAIASGSTYLLPQWSKDGQYLAYIDMRSETLQVYDTNSETTWTVATRVDYANYSWASNGELSYLDYRPDLSGSPFPSIVDLHQVSLRGTNDRIIAHSLSNPTDFIWMSDNKRLLILLEEQKQIGQYRTNNVYMLDLETGQIELYLESLELGLTHIVMIALSTDETVLMIYGMTGQQSEPVQMLVYDLELDTIRKRIVPRQVVPSESADDPQLSPALGGSRNDEWVAGDRWFLAVVNAPTGECYNYALFFLDAIDTSNSFCIPSQGIIADPILSPDLTHIAYINVVAPGQEFLMIGNFPDAIKERLQSP